jgi:two-component system, OmpR family, response regulator RegX3
MSGRVAVLVVEDDNAIRAGLIDLLAFHGFQPTGASDGPSGLEAGLTGAYPLVLLDVMLPGMDGFTVCERLRAAHARVAILLLTARGAEADILRGFEAGADDYVTKPFSIVQLMARVGALTRRHQVPNTIAIGPVQVDVHARIASLGNRNADLTQRDCELLAFLASAGGRAVERDQLLREVWGYARTDAVETRSIDVHIAKLRRKLEALTDRIVIETVRGTGYRVVL